MAQHRDHGAMEERRLKAAKLFESGHSTVEVAKLLGVRRETAYKWKVRLNEGGKKGLRSKGPAGPKARLSEAQCDTIKSELLAGPEAQGYATALWTLPRVAKLIEDRFGIRYHPAHVWKLLRSFGFSCQQPTRRAIERDEAAIADWKQRQWPALKKKRGAKAARSSSSTRAD
jgi:transposase